MVLVAGGLPTVEDVAAHYRERNMLAVVFTVDAITQTGRASVRSDEILEVARANPDVLIPFGSVDPHREDAVEARRLVSPPPTVGSPASSRQSSGTRCAP